MPQVWYVRQSSQDKTGLMGHFVTLENLNGSDWWKIADSQPEEDKTRRSKSGVQTKPFVDSIAKTTLE